MSIILKNKRFHTTVWENSLRTEGFTSKRSDVKPIKSIPKVYEQPIECW